MVWQNRGITLLVLASLLGAASPVHAAPDGLSVQAAGIASYSIVKEGVPPTCAGEGPVEVVYEAATRRILVAAEAVGCVPIWSLISRCSLADDGTVTCKRSGTDTIDITLSPDGTFDYLWDAPDFREEIHGVLVRA